MRVSKEQIALQMPAGMSYYSPGEEAVHLAAQARREAGRGLGRRIADMLALLVDLPRRQAVLNELSGLTDRELADIGLSRADLPRVFDPAFAASRNARARRTAA